MAIQARLHWQLRATERPDVGRDGRDRPVIALGPGAERAPLSSVSDAAQSPRLAATAVISIA